MRLKNGVWRPRWSLAIGRGGGRLGAGLILGAVIAIGAAMIGGGLVWWALADRSEASVKVSLDGGTREDSSGTERILTSADEKTVVDLQPEPAGPTGASSRSTVDHVDSVAPIEGEPAGETEASDRITDRGVPETTEARSPSPRRTPLVAGEFVGEAKVGDVTLTLDYLVYRKENPFAQINGSDVRVGAVVEDFVVKKITVDSVELAKGETTIVIRVH